MSLLFMHYSMITVSSRGPVRYEVTRRDQTPLQAKERRAARGYEKSTWCAVRRGIILQERTGWCRRFGKVRMPSDLKCDKKGTGKDGTDLALDKQR